MSNKSFTDIARAFHIMREAGANDAVPILHAVASEHKRVNKYKRSHHAAAVLCNGQISCETISINNGHLHAEVAAYRRFLQLGVNWSVKHC